LTPDGAPSGASEDAHADRHADLRSDENAASGRVLLDDAGIRRSLMRIAHEVIERTERPERLYLVAIPNGGIPLARRLAENLHQIADLEVPVGVLDTTLYRDDLLTTRERPALRRTEMPSAVDDHVVILVDDVVKTGRTIRAAMDALMDFGRPCAVQVVGLADRGHRELPIKLDYVGKNVPTHPDEEVSLESVGSGEDLELRLVLLSRHGDAGRGDES
jgi:pyrimidine operon attenuation protein/uracil phosphoribosyltransferase